MPSTCYVKSRCPKCDHVIHFDDPVQRHKNGINIERFGKCTGCGHAVIEVYELIHLCMYKGDNPATDEIYRF